jgi:hypothetical protein
MLIKINRSLTKQEIWATGTELASIMGRDRVRGQRVLTYPQNKKMFVASIPEPILLTDSYWIGQQAATLRDTLFSLYNSRPRFVEYDGVEVYWDDSHVNVWCPSIDTILFAAALAPLLKKEKGIESAIEIGCGSGFLSKFVLAKSNSLRQMIVTDINPYAIKCAKDNIPDRRAKFFAGDGLARMKNRKFDLIICNPPYVPRPASIDDNPYEGVGVLNFLLHRAPEYLNPGGLLVINISNLSKKIVFAEKCPLPLELLAKMKVPLKVNNILNNEKWLEYLVEKRDLEKKLVRGYEYWQTIEVVGMRIPAAQ